MQLVIKLIVYLMTMKRKVKLAPMEAEWFCLLFEALYPYLQDTIMWKKTLVTNQTQLEEIAFLLKSMIVSTLSITVRRPDITRCGETSKHKTFLQLYATTLMLVQAVAYKSQQTYESKQAYKGQKGPAPKKSS